MISNNIKQEEFFKKISAKSKEFRLIFQKLINQQNEIIINLQKIIELANKK